MITGKRQRVGEVQTGLDVRLNGGLGGCPRAGTCEGPAFDEREVLLEYSKKKTRRRCDGDGGGSAPL
jgi:hypothetical protein